MSLDRPPAALGWPPAPRSPIPAGLRDQLRQMNRAYLDLLRATPASPEGGCALPPAVLAGLASLPDSACDRLADCTVTLFDLRFGDAAFWADGGAATVADAAEGIYLVRTEQPFVDMALFFAWHVVQCSELAARLLLAMPAATHREFAALPLSRLHRYAAACPLLLQPRWPDHPCFWPDMVDAAGRGDPAALDAALLLCVQLAFSAVEPEAARPRHAHGATPARRTRRR